jgi:hypothetical protein
MYTKYSEHADIDTFLAQCPSIITKFIVKSFMFQVHKKENIFGQRNSYSCVTLKTVRYTLRELKKNRGDCPFMCNVHADRQSLNLGRGVAMD